MNQLFCLLIVFTKVPTFADYVASKSVLFSSVILEKKGLAIIQYCIVPLDQETYFNETIIGNEKIGEKR